MRLTTILFWGAACTACGTQPASTGADPQPQPDPKSAADAGQCAKSLSDAELGTVEIGPMWLAGSAQLTPGSSLEFQLGHWECCYTFEKSDGCVRWSVGSTEYASMDPATGTLTVATDAPNGLTLTVIADIENGRAMRQADVAVYTPESNPWVGVWHETKQLTCNDGVRAPEQPIEEMAFYANGDFTVTWTPFEVYFDYWGRYTFDLDSHALVLTPTGGNFLPGDLDGVGTFTQDSGDTITLHDMWLGSFSAATAEPGCGHEISR